MNDFGFQSSGSGGGGGGTTITTVANYSALPAPNTVSGKFYWCEASQGTKWLPFSIGGTYYPLGMYYSNGSSWEFTETPYQATQSEVNTGTNTDKFVSPSTLQNSSQLSSKVPYTGATQNTDLGTFSLNAKSLHVKGTGGNGHLGLKHQSANITANASESSIGANSSGNPVWKNDGNAIQNILTNDNISQTITNGVTDKAPSEDILFDALLGKQDKVNGLTSGGAITIGTFGANNVRVAAAVWFISPSNYTTAIDTDFSVALSSAGLQRYVGFYGNTSNAIVKVEGTESEYAALPTQPANTALIGYILVTDSAAGIAPDLSTYATIDPRVLTITSSATPTIDVSLYDIVNITALATNITSMTSGLSGVNGNFKSLIINIKDNGVARTITWGSKFSSFFASLPTTTIIGKNLAVGFRYNASTGIYNCWVYSYSI